MEQTTNEATNWHDLFSRYQSLVEPFREFENRSYHKREYERTAGSAKGTISYGYKGIIRNAFGNTLKGAIPFLIVFYVILNVVPVNGEKLFDYYDELITVLLDLTVEEIYVAIYAKTESTLVMLLYGIVGLLLGYVLLPCLVLLFPLMIVYCVISRKHEISQAKTTLKLCEEQMPQAEAAVREAWERIEPHIKYIPPNYRNSNALAFFSNSFFNFKVKNLQEAVNLYDQHLHQQQMQEKQQEILNAQRENMNAINALAGQMDYLSDQLDFMQDQISDLY